MKKSLIVAMTSLAMASYAQEASTTQNDPYNEVIKQQTAERVEAFQNGVQHDSKQLNELLTRQRERAERVMAQKQRQAAQNQKG